MSLRSKKMRFNAFKLATSDRQVLSEFEKA